MFTGDALQRQLAEMAAVMGSGTDLLMVECGRSISCGTSVGLDPLSIARCLGAPLVIISSGSDEDILDDIMFLRSRVDLEGVNLTGFLINGVHAVDNFRELYLPDIEKLSVPVLGIVPHRVELGYFNLRFLADRLFAKVLTCERNLCRIVKHIYIGAMAGDTALQKPFFRKSDKLIITGGDRTDMILAAIESNSAGILLTNNILPPANILARVEESGVPMLLANTDTNEAARRIAGLQPLLTIEDRGRIDLLRELVAAHINVPALIGNTQ
jgi:BioD-like phosphotransacetylase family protein